MSDIIGRVLARSIIEVRWDADPTASEWLEVAKADYDGDTTYALARVYGESRSVARVRLTIDRDGRVIDGSDDEAGTILSIV